MSTTSDLISTEPVHATLIAGWRAGRWRGVLLQGPSGAGKSSLALQAMAAGWALVADDRTRLWASGGRLYGAAPARLTGLVEARGQGVLRRPALRAAEVALVVQPGEEERMPARQVVELAGARLPVRQLDFGAPGAVVRLNLALDAALAPSAVL